MSISTIAVLGINEEEGSVIAHQNRPPLQMRNENGSRIALLVPWPRRVCGIGSRIRRQINFLHEPRWHELAKQISQICLCCHKSLENHYYLCLWILAIVFESIGTRTTLTVVRLSKFWTRTSLPFVTAFGDEKS